MPRRLLFAIPLLAASLLLAMPLAAESGSPRSPRNANYTIVARLDAAARTVDGRLTLRWTNLQERPTAELWFHLYWNAWRNDQSTWMRDDRLADRVDEDDVRPEDWSFQQVRAARLVVAGGAGGDRTTVDLPRRFAAPEAYEHRLGSPEDRSVMVVDLPTAVGPGESVEVEIEWTARVPRTFARTGFRDQYFFLAHWFPKLGVYEPEGWHCRPFRALTEFYSDYGVYDVSLTTPTDFVVGATGREREARDNGDGTTTRRFVEEDVHAFTWTASPLFTVHQRRFEVEGLPPVEMRLLLQPEHADQAERHFDATAAALEYYGRWYGAYPYGHITIVDPAWQSSTGGMEYPTLFTAGTRLSNPVGGGSPEGVTIHEAGHQFWYGLVGNNEFDHAWLDEGLNTFSTARVYDVVYGDKTWMERYLEPPGTDLPGFVAVLFPEIRLGRGVYGNRFHRFLDSEAPIAGPISDPTHLYFPPTAGRLSYDKTALWLETLERHLGWDVLQGILSTFFQRWRFGHPRPEDFFAVASEVAGQDLGWFFDQVWGRSVIFDYAVHSVESVPVGITGLDGGGADDTGEPAYREADEGDEALYRSEVVVRRRGEGVFPVDIELVFEDGEVVRQAWDGRDAWKLLTVERPAKLRSAVVDPRRVLLLDLDYRNNSRLRESEAPFAASKWSTKWMVWLQDLMLTFTLFV